MNIISRVRHIALCFFEGNNDMEVGGLLLYDLLALNEKQITYTGD